MSLDDGFTAALNAFEAVRTKLSSYNAEVAVANSLIAERKRSVQVTSVSEAEAVQEKLKAQKNRFLQEARDTCDAYVKANAEKTTEEVKRANVRDLLNTHTETVITQYGSRINWYLDRINASFKITTPTYTYRGSGTPSTTYQILINDRAVDLGDAETPANLPSFRNTLSAGDRSTLALAFFFAQLEQDPTRGQKVVVFDDPFASMDSFRRSHTVNQIFRCGEACAQVIVLSHDPGFLYLLWERVAPANRKTLTLARITEESTNIHEWDIEKAVQKRYLADIEMLSRFYSDGEGEQRDVIQKVEAHLRGVLSKSFSHAI